MAKPVRPEPKHFLNDIEYAKGLSYYLEKYFNSSINSPLWVGEKGTSYLEYDFVATRILHFFSQARVLVILRNPTERALSNYFFSFENGLEKRTLRQVFIEEIPPPIISMETSVSPFSYIERGHYLYFLRPYINIFGENLKIVVFEELVGNKHMIKSIYDFLNVNSTFHPPSIYKKINENRYIGEKKDLYEVQEKLRQYFRPHVAMLEDFLNRKIIAWHDKI